MIIPEILQNLITDKHTENPSLEGCLQDCDSDTGLSDDALDGWLHSNSLLLIQVLPSLTHTNHICSTFDSLARQHCCDTFLCLTTMLL